MKQERPKQAMAVAGTMGSDLVVRRATHLIVAQTRNLWVLHKQLGIRLIALLLVAGIGATLVHNRIHILNYMADVSARTSALFAQAGLSVAEISLSGYALMDEETLFAAIGLEPHVSLVNFDAEAARVRVEALQGVEQATIRKIYPNSLVVELVEKQPVAIWTVDGVNFAIDSKGERIAAVAAPIDGLPLFVGDGASNDAPEMIELLSGHPIVAEGLLASSRIGDRRWDLIYSSGLRIMLPEDGVVDAFAKIEQLNQTHQLFERDIAVLDLRLPEYVAVRPVDRTPVEASGVEAQ